MRVWCSRNCVGLARGVRRKLGEPAAGRRQAWRAKEITDVASEPPDFESGEAPPSFNFLALGIDRRSRRARSPASAISAANPAAVAAGSSNRVQPLDVHVGLPNLPEPASDAPQLAAERLQIFRRAEARRHLKRRTEPPRKATRRS